MPVSVESPMKSIKSKVKVEKMPVMDEPENIPTPARTKKKFSKAEIEYVHNLVKNGYHVKDILKKCKVYLALSDEKLEKVKAHVMTGEAL